MKFWRKPKDEKKDHMNFLQHLAGRDKQLEFTEFSNSATTLGKYDTAVEASQNYFTIRKPKGRVPFNANLLTAGQVKFSAHNMSQRVRDKLGRSITKRARGIDSWTGKASVQVYDAVYGILENRRCAFKASEHFHRPKILTDHLKEMADKSQSRWGYASSIHGENAQDFEVDWGEFRKYLYGHTTLREIKNPIIESLCRRHKDLIKRVKDNRNPTATILAALEIASDFWVTQEKSSGGQAVPDSNGDVPVDVVVNGVNVNETKSDDIDPDDAIQIAQDMMDEVKDEVTEDYKQDQVRNSGVRTTAGVKELPDDATFDDVVDDDVENSETIKSAKGLTTGNRCGAEIFSEVDTLPYFSTIDINALELDSQVDKNRVTLGTNGSRMKRNRAWRLPFLGDPNVFQKNPATGADLIVLLDISISMGHCKEVGEGRGYLSPYQVGLDYGTAIRSRFPNATVLGFTKVPREHREDGLNAGLYPITENTIPDVGRGSTPLCGALKGIEDHFNLDNARVLVITDGQPNDCNSGDSYECVTNRTNAWINKGIRFGIVWISHYMRNDHPLPTDFTIHKQTYESANADDLEQVFRFMKG